VLVIGSLTLPGTGILVVCVGHWGLGFSSRVSKQNFVYILRSTVLLLFKGAGDFLRKSLRAAFLFAALFPTLQTPRAPKTKE
jgi:hypothetical protein